MLRRFLSRQYLSSKSLSLKHIGPAIKGGCVPAIGGVARLPRASKASDGGQGFIPGYFPVLTAGNKTQKL
jgi:hypothetical protein